MHRETRGGSAAPATSTSASTRALLWAVLVVGTPLALAASVLSALLRSGATVHVVALRPTEGATR